MRSETVDCPHCGESLMNPLSLAGQVVQCPLCGQQFQMPVVAPVIMPPAPVVVPQPGSPRSAAPRNYSRRGSSVNYTAPVVGGLVAGCGAVVLLCLYAVAWAPSTRRTASQEAAIDQVAPAGQLGSKSPRKTATPDRTPVAERPTVSGFPQIQFPTFGFAKGHERVVRNYLRENANDPRKLEIVSIGEPIKLQGGYYWNPDPSTERAIFAPPDRRVRLRYPPLWSKFNMPGRAISVKYRDATPMGGMRLNDVVFLVTDGDDTEVAVVSAAEFRQSVVLPADAHLIESPPKSNTEMWADAWRNHKLESNRVPRR